jgi:2'-phosphotransferase
MRSSSQIFIYINIQTALSSGIQFFFSDNGVVLTAGDDKGFLKPEFFLRVENAKRQALPGWEGPGPVKAVERVREAVGGGYESPPGQKDEKIVEEGIQRMQLG